MELANWLQSIADRRWPILPATLDDVQAACARHAELINISELSNLCLSDPLLLFDLLRAIGTMSALHENDAAPTVEQAVMLMGLERVTRRFAQVTALRPQAGKLDDEVVEVVADWLGRSRVAAYLVKDWLSLHGEHKVEDCFVAALLYNLPACFFLLYRNQLPDQPLLQAVSGYFGLDYPKLLERFIQAAGLPRGLLTLLGSGGTTTPRKQLLKLAVATANGIGSGWWRSPWTTGIEVAARQMRISYEEAYRCVLGAAESVAKKPRAPAYTYPIRELLMLPGEHPPRASMTATAALNEVEQLEQLMRESIRHLANDLRFERILFLRYDQAAHALRLRYQIGLAESSPLRRLAVELEPGSFFALLTGKPQSFHAPAQVRAQLGAKYQDPFFDHIGDGEFAVMTLYTGHTLSGVFYVDNGNSGRAIDPDTYHRFKDLVTRLARHP
ncbi:HDOD domain-containing protein [Pseudogulbenkiania sp. MAI-1]|uniref:HDOD domain-containing protein n=1 Tax=Pseudogulbenkiania sp. MAI-1 TaxID=990370 RepID=UPI00045E855A|nr:HDOD domain-containing protein [Pseudogulbenkiania sp. MAI-1]